MRNHKKRKKLLGCALLLVTTIVFQGCASSFLGCLTIRVTTDDEAEPHFYFAQFTDTHFGDWDHYERTEKIVETINKLPMEIEFVVVTGDITSNNIEDESVVTKGISIVNKLEAPVHFVPGNHDILSWEHDLTMQIYKKHFGELFAAYEYKGAMFIFVYTEPLAQSFSLDFYDPLREVEAALKSAAGKPTFVFHHTPSVEDFYLNMMHDGWEKEVREKWEKLLNSYNVKAVIAGHFHRDEHHWLGDVPLYICAPVGGKWGRQTTFRIYEYKNGKLGYRTQYLE